MVTEETEEEKSWMEGIEHEWWSISPMTLMVVAAIAAVTGCALAWWFCTAYATTVSTTGAVAAIRNDDVQTVASVMHEAEDDQMQRQTTVRHKAKGELPTSDIRRDESPSQTISRTEAGHKKDNKEAEKYSEWKKTVANLFTYGDLPPEKKEKLTVLTYAYKDIFADNPKAPALIHGIEHALYFQHEDPMPVRRKQPRLSPEQMEFMDKDTQTMLKNHIIEFSESEWATAPVFARKKDGQLRYCCDYRQLNSLLCGDYPISARDTRALSKAARYSAVGACAGFWGVRMRPKDRKYTAFHARYNGSWHLF